jgi:hypothetical protein
MTKARQHERQKRRQAEFVTDEEQRLLEIEDMRRSRRPVNRPLTVPTICCPCPVLPKRGNSAAAAGA